jgi:hypothetical protein
MRRAFWWMISVALMSPALLFAASPRFEELRTSPPASTLGTLPTLAPLPSADDREAWARARADLLGQWNPILGPMPVKIPLP